MQFLTNRFCIFMFELKDVESEEVITMETQSSSFIFWGILLALFWLGIFVIPRILLRRAISQVIRIFRGSHSLCSENAKTVDELGLAPPSLTERLFKPRDYKPYALQFLIRAGLVRVSGEGRMCLLENKTAEFVTANRLGE